MVDVEFRVLGATQVLADGLPLPLGSAKQRSLLAFLVINVGEVQPADRIIDALWGENPPSSGVKTLQWHVSQLRSALGDCRSVLASRDAGYILEAPPETIDSVRFEKLLKEAEATLTQDPERASHLCDRALTFWQGRAYQDFQYEEFAQAEARRLEEMRLTATELRIDAELAAGRTGGLVADLEALLTEHPLRERLWGQLMMALYRTGRQPEALRSYQRACEVFGELGTAPSGDLARLEELILLRDVSLEAGHSAEGGAAAIGDYLPTQRTSFVGRRQEIALGGDLIGECRLVTLTGPPGSGKTRIAVELAREQQPVFTHGVFFVALAAVNDPYLVDATISQAIGLREVAGQSPLDGLRSYLRDRQMLLILDNFEQVVEAAPVVGEVLDGAPGVKILVTSRTPLGLSGEQEFPIPPLGVPGIGGSTAPEELAANEAVSLFGARARASNPQFRIDESNVAAVVGIVNRLDGLPLAIELAAARAKLFAPDELLRRLDRRMDLLTGGPTDAEDHHRTLRDAIAWSYGLLEPVEQELFRSLGVFRSFTLEAAGVVTGSSDLKILEGVDSLLSKSLIYHSGGGGGARFAMLETLRDFAVEQLAESGFSEEVAREHARYFANMVVDCEPQLTGADRRAAMDRLAAELDNIRSALGYALGTSPDLGLDMAGRMWRFWECTGQIAEGRQWLESLLAHPDASRQQRARGLTGLGGLLYWQSEFREAEKRYGEALGLYKAVGDRRGEADTLTSMSMTASWAGDPDSGERLADDARSVLEGLDAIDEAGMAVMAKAFALQLKGDFAASRPMWEEALAVSRQSGNRDLVTSQVISSAIFEYHAGNTEEALRIARGAFEEAVDAQNVSLAAWMLDFVAAYAAPGAPEVAVRLAGAAYAIRQVAGGGMPLEPLGIEDARSAASGALSPQQLDDAWDAGRKLSLEAAAALAVQLQPATTTKAPTTPVPNGGG